MAKMKKLFATCLTLCLMLSLSTAVPSENREVPVASADFKKMCDQVFYGNGQVYNASGADVTTSFLTKYNGIYQSGKIIGFPSPIINVSFSDLGALFSGSLDSIRTTQPSISSNKTFASCSVTTTHTVSCPIPVVDYITGTLEPSTSVSKFTIEV
ncbi:hypothetical protein [Clostridium porci]|uniref:Uncharacterized protein n=1 Tax=Clostridium porci TaxID=2605778 RepID=A0A7X2NPH6_9CLOT|nr:hypothetical protein [Clostridium porci]MSS38672.1 hypothetical protein [Clostridium porci]